MKPRRMQLLFMSAIATMVVVVPAALAQRGVGDPAGVAQLAEKPATQQMSGEVLEIVKGPCKQTSGCSIEGYHLRLKTENDADLNLHLGPVADVEALVEGLNVGEQVSFEAFRTEKLVPGEMIARTITFDDHTVVLRDETLRPAWAGQPRNGQGRGQGIGRGRGARGGQR